LQQDRSAALRKIVSEKDQKKLRLHPQSMTLAVHFWSVAGPFTYHTLARSPSEAAFTRSWLRTGFYALCVPFFSDLVGG
jgi:hypothetical protein